NRVCPPFLFLSLVKYHPPPGDIHSTFPEGAAHEALATDRSGSARLGGSQAPAAEPSARAPAAKTDPAGDPLPEGAVPRLGSKRWRIPAEPGQFALSGDGSLLSVGTKSLSVGRVAFKTWRGLAVLGTPTFRDEKRGSVRNAGHG